MAMSRPQPWLQSTKRTIEVLQKYGLRFQKRYGQNFLIDPHVLNKIMSAAEVGTDDFVLEIGPGIGTLTQQLAYSAREVVSVEIDKALLEVLDDTLSGYDNVTIINNDVLKVDLGELVKSKNDNKPIKVVANLPYYITTPIIMNFFENHIPVESITVMVQKEVAQRMSAKPGTKEYGVLSLAVQYYSEPYLVANVPPNCFMPRPDVASAVIRLSSKKEKQPVKDEQLMFKIIKAAFAQRRKTLMNCLKNSSEFNLSKEQWEAILEEAGIAANVRGETLGLEEFSRLADAIVKLAGEP